MRRGGRARVAFSLRVKITLTFLLIGSLASILLALGIVTILQRSMFAELQNRVSGLARIGVELVDPEAFQRLLARISPDMPGDDAIAVEDSADFRSISDALNAVRATEERLVHYIYLFAPTPDPDTALFVVDADLLADRDLVEAGELSADELTHFGSPFDLSDFPVARRAIAEGIPLVEEDYTWDEAYGVNSLTGYAPLFSRDGTRLLGVLGIDMVDTDVRAVLRRARDHLGGRRRRGAPAHDPRLHLHGHRCSRGGSSRWTRSCAGSARRTSRCGPRCARATRWAGWASASTPWPRRSRATARSWRPSERLREVRAARVAAPPGTSRAYST